MPAAGTELTYLATIVSVLVAVSAFVAWRQIRTLRGLSKRADMDADERRFVTVLAWRRFVNSALMLVLAILLAGTYWFGQERRAAELGVQQQAEIDSDSPPRLSDDENRFLRQYSVFWVAFTLILLGVVSLALYDLWAIRRFARRSFRQIKEDRRAMIEEQVAEYRRQRNGR